MGSSNADLSFGSGIGAADVGNVTERIRIKHDTGNVGIGSAIPTAKLDVAGSLNVTGVSTFAGVINSTVSTGTAPFVVASTTLVTNLNADLLDGKSTANSKVGNSVVTRNAAGGFSAGDVTFDNIVGVAATFSGNVSVGGTLTYEDVTNIDSLGIVTARTGIKVLAGGINAVGVVTATSFSGDGSALTGISAGFEQDDQGNLVAGTNAGANKDADTCFNVFMGCNAGQAMNAGDHHIFIGQNAGRCGQSTLYLSLIHI